MEINWHRCIVVSLSYSLRRKREIGNLQARFEKREKLNMNEYIYRPLTSWTNLVVASLRVFNMGVASA